MDTAQQKIGELGVDKIKKIFSEELTEWEKEEIALWAAQSLLQYDPLCKNLAAILLPYNSADILNTLSMEDIINYFSENKNKLRDLFESLTDKICY